MKAIKDIEYMYTMQEITDIVDKLFPINNSCKDENGRLIEQDEKDPTIDDSCNCGENGRSKDWITFIGWRDREARARKDYVTGLFLKLWNINLWLKGEIEPYKYVTYKEIQEKKEERQRVYDELCKELGISTANVDNEKETVSINTKPQQKQEKQKPTRRKGRPKRPFKDRMINDADGSKLKKIHELMKGKYGKDAALIMWACIHESWILQPTFTEVKEEFGDIGTQQNFTKYLNGKQFSETEKSGATNSLYSS